MLAPGVSDDPVFFASIVAIVSVWLSVGAISNKKDSVVDLSVWGAALQVALGDDSSAVRVEAGRKSETD